MKYRYFLCLRLFTGLLRTQQPCKVLKARLLNKAVKPGVEQAHRNTELHIGQHGLSHRVQHWTTCTCVSCLWLYLVLIEEGVIVEVDRFDPGRCRGDDLIVPTALMPGDVAIPCQV